MDARQRLTRNLLWLILIAALATTPVFLLAEEFDAAHAWRVAGSNGVCALLCLGLLLMVRRGRAEAAANCLVWGLLVLVGVLAWTNGEDVHVNVVNFVLVTVLASVLLGRRALLAVGALSASLMVAIAWKQAVEVPGEELFEVRLESIAQFLPTFAVVVTILWLRERAEPHGGACAT